MKNTVVVGVNVGHDGGAAIVVDGKLTCAISEERLNRKRYSHGYLNSFQYCLSAAGLNIKDISLIVFSSYGETLPTNYQGELKYLGLPNSKFLVVDHHLSHAYSTFFYSPFNDALILVIDGQGNNNDTESYYIGEGQTIKKIGGNSQKRNPARGIGRTYEAFTNFIGWTDQEAGKTMGLAAYGDSSQVKIPLFNLKGLEINSNLDFKYEKGVVEFCKKYKLNFGSPYEKKQTEKTSMVASFVQKETERIVLELVEKLIQKTGKRKLCLAGGVALNCNLNSKILESGLIEDLFIIPAASDRGQSVGNAIYGYQKLNGYVPHQSIKNDYFGKVYYEKEILQALRRKRDSHVRKTSPYKKISFEKQTNIVKTTAFLLKDQAIIGWFQGKSELGPRALGHRSILCDARRIEMKNILNKRIKHRESFRPFAPSCLFSEASRYFKIDRESPYMLLTPQVKHDKKKQIPAIVHTDQTARLQTVARGDNDVYYQLLKKFFELTGTPLLLNTSFNNQEPIVESPGDAINTFLTTKLDYLIIHDYLIWKE